MAGCLPATGKQPVAQIAVCVSPEDCCLYEFVIWLTALLSWGEIKKDFCGAPSTIHTQLSDLIDDILGNDLRLILYMC